MRASSASLASPGCGALKAHHRHTQFGMAEEGIDVRPQRQLVVEGAITSGVAPGFLFLEDRQHVLRGTASTRVNRSEQSSASASTMLMEQEPMVTLVTPWRTDSFSAGAAITSAS